MNVAPLFKQAFTRTTPSSLTIGRGSCARNPGKQPRGFRDAPMSLISPVETFQYGLGALSEDNVDKNPENQFRKWFDDAVAAGLSLPETVNLATAELPSGKVSNRNVLLKELDSDGNFVIYSNWKTSRKASDFNTNPYVSLTFFWKELQRQVRVEGKATRMSREESQPYFDTRPRGSRIAAWASQQSSPVASRDVLEEQVAEVEKRFEGQEHIPCPPYWGGIKITPDHYEFWQGRQNRVHDRIVYDREGKGWKRYRIAP